VGVGAGVLMIFGRLRAEKTLQKIPSVGLLGPRGGGAGGGGRWEKRGEGVGGRRGWALGGFRVTRRDAVCAAGGCFLDRGELLDFGWGD